MSTKYSHPLSLGLDRMKKALFQPFDITKWFRIGFTAWLAGLADCSGGSGGSNYSGNRNNFNIDDLFSFPQTAWNWLTDNPLWFNLIIIGLVLIFIISTVIFWISSRGKFMFLHNVANNKDEISDPWREYKKQGNSLFVWRFFYGWVVSIVVIIFFIYFFVTAKSLHFADAPSPVIFTSIATMILIIIVIGIIFGYISLFLNDFVVPIMYKNKIGVLKGWGTFLKLFKKKFGSFIIYGLFIFVLTIAVVIAVIFFALLTCCIGLLLIAIPFIGAVILLPISYTYRAFSIEFLAQFGEEYNVFPETNSSFNQS